MRGGKVLRELLERPEILILPGAFDALSARIIEQEGFDAVYVSGAGFANATFGLPDIGLTGMAEVVEHLSRIADAVDIPVVVDADTGYGGVLQVRRTVRACERSGAAAIQLEDQVMPKRCGHFDGHQLIPAEEMVGKIAMAVDARSSEDLVVIARTDARSVEGLEAAVLRANLYADAGADVLFIEAPQSREEVLSLPERVSVPLIANVVDGGKTPALSASELCAAGYKVALFANVALRASMKAVSGSMRLLHASGGDSSAVASAMISWEERQRLVSLQAYEELESRFSMPSPPQ